MIVSIVAFVVKNTPDLLKSDFYKFEKQRIIFLGCLHCAWQEKNKKKNFLKILKDSKYDEEIIKSLYKKGLLKSYLSSGNVFILDFNKSFYKKYKKRIQELELEFK